MKYIYVLHFHQAHAHARHYIGMTGNLRRRLARHAAGQGSNLCRVLRDNSELWYLGGLYQCSDAQAVRMERRLKDRHNGADFCQHCSGQQQRSMDSLRPIDIGIVPYDTRSDKITPFETVQTVHKIGDVTDQQHLEPQIRRMMSQHKEQLGFIPACGLEGLGRWFRQSTVAVAQDGDNLIAYAGCTITPSMVKIQQCCTDDAERFCGHGRQLIALLAERNPEKILQAKVRNDLAANEFWTQIGFTMIGDLCHKTSRKTLNIYQKQPQKGVS